ncbi:MAG TPA: DNA repair protein RecN, partial [Armatimonadetes bacterium]|nr:DNA repair protein RecN [Armatimonadota bacterium]
MLKELTICNFALIDELHIRLEPGLNVLTGETGAGKSIIINAINLIVGERADVEQIRSGADVAIVEALFDIRAHNALRELLRNEGWQD